MTKDYKLKVLEAIDEIEGSHSAEACASVRSAIHSCGDDVKDNVTSKKFLDEVKDKASAYTSLAKFDAYDWLKANDIKDFTPAFCAGARYVLAVAYWFLKKEALDIVDEIHEALKGGGC